MDFDTIIAIYNEFRDRIAAKTYGEWGFKSYLFGLVLVQMFRYGFNTYKAIGLLLPDLYYEQASSLLRTLWETSLDLHWIAQDPEKRSKQFSQYTVLEYRKSLEQSLAAAKNEGKTEEARSIQSSIIEYDRATASVLRDYQFLDRKGRSMFYKSFANRTPEEFARELGENWPLSTSVYTS